MFRTLNYSTEKLFIGGRWLNGGPPIEVINKYNGEVIGTVATAQKKEVEEAISAAVSAVTVMGALPTYRRAEVLLGVAALLKDQKELFARTIASESGKALKFARLEVDRAAITFTCAAEEAKRIHGETVCFDAIPAGEGYFGFWLRRPVGVVAAITPFNFPLNLVAHKVAPAIAAGNAVILKPATATPLTALLLCRILEEAGLPPGGLNLVIGKGETVGERLVSDPRIAKITFTGSADVGEHLLAKAGIKKVTLELGNNSPVIICPDAALDFAANRCAVGAFYNSGQVCVSVQRVYVHRSVCETFTEKFVSETKKLQVGDPLEEDVDVGPMIDQKEVARIASWINEAKALGARILTGGKYEGAVYWPTLLANVEPHMKVVAEEAFAPVASIIPFDDFEDAVKLADATSYGLQASIFTRDINRIINGVRALNFGGVIINDTPSFRADQMPYGGNKQSGLGREGLRFAIEEMTNIQTVAVRLE